MSTVEFTAELLGSLEAARDRLRGREIPLLTWAQQYVPHYFEFPPSKLHIWLSERLSKLHKARGAKIWIIAPRGAAKSTWITFLYPLWAVCHGTETYIVIAADTLDQAQRYLAGIKEELTSNLALKAAYPKSWGEGPLWQKEGCVTANDVRIDAVGTGKALRGRRDKSSRPSLVLVDDPEGDEAVFSALIRKRTRDWWERTVLKVGDHRTNYIAAGTVLHRECLVNHIAVNPLFYGQRFRSIGVYPRALDLWAAWEELLRDHRDPARLETAREFYESHRSDMEDGAEVLWPEREPLYELMSQRAAGRVAFECEKQNNPTDPSAVEFPEDYFEPDGSGNEIWFGGTLDPGDVVLSTLFLDPSKGKETKVGDYASYVLAQLARNGLVYVTAWLGYEPIDQLIQRGVNLALRFQPDAFGMEVNNFQELFARELFRAVKEAELALTISPVVNTVKKEIRIRKLDPWLSQRRLRFRDDDHGRLLVDQTRDFPVGDHDDGPDALEGALRLLQVLQGREEAPGLDDGTRGVDTAWTPAGFGADPLDRLAAGVRDPFAGSDRLFDAFL